MSFILDALRKVDRETRPSDEVLPPVAAIEKLRKEKRGRRLQFAAMAAIGIASAVATTLLLRRSPVPDPGAAPEPLAAETSAETSDGTPAAAAVEMPVVEAPVPDSSAVVPDAEPDPPVEVVELGPPPPAPEPARELPQLVLQGTSVLAGKPVAVVSDRRVFEGDTIEGAVVIRIEERLVELEFEGRRFTLTL